MIDEPMLKKKNVFNRILSNQLFVTMITTFLMVFIIIGSSYAVFFNNYDTNNESDVLVQSGELEVVISSESDEIITDYVTPGVSDEVGKTYTPYNFTVTNTGENKVIYYEIRVVDKEYSNSTMPHIALSFIIREEGGEYTMPANLADCDSYVYFGNELEVGESKTFDLIIWVNEEFGELAKDKVVNLALEITLYSELPTRNYIIYDLNGGSGVIPKTSVSLGKITDKIPIKDNCDFIGWAKDKNSKTIDYRSNDPYDSDKGIVLYAIWKERNVMDVFPITIKNNAPKVTKIFFIDDTEENIDKRYNAASIKADLTYQNQGRVLGWMETDLNDSSYYHLYVGSDGTTYFNTGRYLFSDETTSYQFSKLTSIDFANVNTSMVTDMTRMFEDCVALTNLDLSHFDTSNVTNMSSMFAFCKTLSNVDLSSFDTNKVTDMDGMFFYCSYLSSLDITHFDTSNVTNMHTMFYYCSKLETLNLDNFDTSQVTNMGLMFNGCSSLKELDLSSFDTRLVTDMNTMFCGCRGMYSLKFSDNFSTDKVTNMSYMFQDCKTIEQLDLSHFDTSNVTNMSSMFKNCGLISSIGYSNSYAVDISNFNTSNVKDMSGIFYGCYKLSKMDLSHFDTSNVTNMNYMFYSCRSITSAGRGSEYDLNLISFNTSKVTNMANMFYGCSIVDMDVSGFDTSQVTNMSYMFGNNSFSKLDLSNFNTSKVTSIGGMFYNCSSIQSVGPSNEYDVNLSTFDTKLVTNMNRMFSQCKALTEVNLSNFVTSKVTDMSRMFDECISLTSLDLSNFDTSSLTNMGSYSDYVNTKMGMFNKCSSLKVLDLSSFNFSTITTYTGAFDGMPVDAIIYVRSLNDQNLILGLDAAYRPAWTDANVVVKSS